MKIKLTILTILLALAMIAFIRPAKCETDCMGPITWNAHCDALMGCLPNSPEYPNPDWGCKDCGGGSCAVIIYTETMRRAAKREIPMLANDTRLDLQYFR